LYLVAQKYVFMMFFSIWTEKIAEKGEDAPATLLIDEENGTGILSVYDGLGGSGSTPYTVGQKSFSGAYLASRLAMQVTEQAFVQHNPQIENFATPLEKYLKTAFSLKIAQLDQQRSKLKSKLIRRLPTTVAGVVFRVEEGETMSENIYHTESFWAGDSRVYVLKKDGLKQISEDNLTENLDAFENLQKDAPIANCINADDDFVLYNKKIIFKEPIVLITATDGVFGYLPTPFHFEYYLLATLHHPLVCDTEQWKNFLTWSLEDITGDDMSLSLITLGYGNDLMNLKVATLDRFLELRNQYIKPLRSNTSEDARLILWEKYKKTYYQI
jgi:serine/threonine protein phosphatase PrpC